MQINSEPTLNETTSALPSSSIEPSNDNNSKPTVNKASIASPSKTIVPAKGNDSEPKQNEASVASPSKTVQPSAEVSKAPSHQPLSVLLQKYVNANGRVDYAGLKQDRAKLDAYLSTLSQNPPADSWSRNERLAYWINAYNAATLRLIVDNYPLTSIQNLDGGKTWDVKRVKLGDRSYSLNQIENEIIRPRFKEPRIHFALNCAAIGCPPLRNEAFTAEKIEFQLEEQTKKILNNSYYTSLSGKTLKVPKIFDWYGEDFSDVAKFVGKYRDVPAGATVAYVDYDWALNKQ